MGLLQEINNDSVDDGCACVPTKKNEIKPDHNEMNPNPMREVRIVPDSAKVTPTKIEPAGE